MIIKTYKWVAVFIFALGIQAHAEILKPVKWSFSSKKVSANTYDLILEARIDEGWHLYSQHIGENGPVPTSFTFKSNADITLVGDVKEKSKAIKVQDPNFNMEVIYFKNKAIFVQRVKVSKSITSIDGSLEFMVCNDNKCLPPETKSFTFNLDQADVPVVIKDIKKITTENIQPAHVYPISPVTWTYDVKNTKGNEYELTAKAHIFHGLHLNGQTINGKNNFKSPEIRFASNDSFKSVDFLLTTTKTTNFTLADGSTHIGYDSQAIFTQKIVLLKKSKFLNGVISCNVCNEKECLPTIQSAFSIAIPKDKVVAVLEGNKPLTTIFWLCFLGGFAALFTPCVYPMIPLTVSFFTKHNENKTSGVASATLFGFSIIVIYVALGLIITFVFGRNGLNNLASNVYTNLAFFVIFLVFAFSFLGAFDINLPSSWANKSDSRAEKGGIIGIFFIALTLTIVSFSCTSPVIGPLVYFAASGGGYAGPAIGMMGFALAWALPFSFFAMFPALMQKLPKSGGWLNSVKVTFGFLELALALKFLSTADLTYNWGLLKREYFLALWIIIFGLLGLYLLGKLKLSHDTPVAHISVTRLMLAILSFAFSLYMVPGLWGAPVRLLSGIAPPSTYSEWIRDPEQPSQSSMGSAGLAKSSDTEKLHKYHDLFKSPHGINAYYDYDEALAAARAAHKPLMLDFTGHACTNCRLMEENVWSDSKALSMLKDDYILVSLYADDRTDLPANEVYVSKYSGDKISDIGDKWKDLETGRYNTNALPFYVLLDNNEKEIGKYDGYDPNIAKFVGFLESGKSEFQKSAPTASAN